jgi:hypothetical protein
MSVAHAAQGQFILFQYTWAYEGEPQDGLLMLGFEPKPNEMQAVWIDSWHMQDKLMFCRGTIGRHCDISLKGSYPAPPRPNWGWQIDITPRSPNGFRLQMYNISPEGKSQLAVEAGYTRKG